MEHAVTILVRLDVIQSAWHGMPVQELRDRPGPSGRRSSIVVVPVPGAVGTTAHLRQLRGGHSGRRLVDTSVILPIDGTPLVQVSWTPGARRRCRDGAFPAGNGGIGLDDSLTVPARAVLL